MGIGNKGTIVFKSPVNLSGSSTINQEINTSEVTEKLAVTEPDTFCDKESSRRKSGQGFSSAFFHFKHKVRDELNKTDPNSKLNMKTLRDKWQAMDEENKSVFHEMARCEKEAIGDNFRKDIRENTLSMTERNERRKETNLKHYQSRKKDEESKSSENETIAKKLKEFVVTKETKLRHLTTFVESLKSQVEKNKELNKETSVAVMEKDVEILVLKEKYKALHKLHSSCKKNAE